MKKLLSFLFLFATAQMSYCQGTYQLFSVTPFTQLEKINDSWTMTAPIDLQYNIIKFLGADKTYFIGGGVGAGVNFNGNGNGTINLNFPITAYIGGEPIQGFPAMAIGGGINAQNGNPLLMINLHFLATEIIPSIPKSNTRTIVTNDAYKRSNIGFKHD